MLKIYMLQNLSLFLPDSEEKGAYQTAWIENLVCALELVFHLQQNQVLFVFLFV